MMNTILKIYTNTKQTDSFDLPGIMIKTIRLSLERDCTSIQSRKNLEGLNQNLRLPKQTKERTNVK